jgi:hypothetical protein
LPTEADHPRAGARGKAAGAGAETGRRPPVPSARALQKLLDELGAARAMLDEATQAMRAVDTRIRSWDRAEARGFLARRGRVLHDEATTRFARSLDGLHAMLVRLADRGDSMWGRALSSRLRAPRTRRLQARIRQELRGLQRAFDGGGALLARSIETFE